MACSVWNVRRIPHRARRKCGIASRSVPKARTVPDAGRTKPDRTLKKVVLPAPFGPMRPQVPCSKTRSMLSSEVTPPYRTVRLAISSMPHQLHDPAAEFLHVLRELVGDAGRRGGQDLQHAHAEQDREPRVGQAQVLQE